MADSLLALAQVSAEQIPVKIERPEEDDQQTIASNGIYPRDESSRGRSSSLEPGRAQAAKKSRKKSNLSKKKAVSRKIQP